MLWFFERGDQVVRLETRFDSVTREYVVGVTWAEGPPQTERYATYTAFNRRIIALENQLIADEWTQLGGPTILMDGWRDRSPDQS